MTVVDLIVMGGSKLPPHRVATSLSSAHLVVLFGLKAGADNSIFQTYKSADHVSAVKMS